MSDKFGFSEMIHKLQAAKTKLPKELAMAGQLYFQQNFDKQQWDGVKWEARKNIFSHSGFGLSKKVAKSRVNTKALLVKTGKLRQSMQRTIRSYDWKMVVWGNDVPYAKYQNFGTEHLPKREFLGGSKELEDKLQSIIVKNFNQIMGV